MLTVPTFARGGHSFPTVIKLHARQANREAAAQALAVVLGGHEEGPFAHALAELGAGRLIKGQSTAYMILANG